jgi:hypothetical protein
VSGRVSSRIVTPALGRRAQGLGRLLGDLVEPYRLPCVESALTAREDEQAVDEPFGAPVHGEEFGAHALDLLRRGVGQADHGHAPLVPQHGGAQVGRCARRRTGRQALQPLAQQRGLLGRRRLHEPSRRLARRDGDHRDLVVQRPSAGSAPARCAPRCPRSASPSASPRWSRSWASAR